MKRSQSQIAAAQLRPQSHMADDVVLVVPDPNPPPPPAIIDLTSSPQKSQVVVGSNEAREQELAQHALSLQPASRASERAEDGLKADLTKQVRALKGQVESLTNANASLTQHLSVKEKQTRQVGALKGQVETLTNANASLTQQLSVKQKQTRQAQCEKQCAEQIVKNMKEENKTLKENLILLEKECTVLRDAKEEVLRILGPSCKSPSLVVGAHRA